MQAVKGPRVALGLFITGRLHAARSRARRYMRRALVALRQRRAMHRYILQDLKERALKARAVSQHLIRLFITFAVIWRFHVGLPHRALALPAAAIDDNAPKAHHAPAVVEDNAEAALRRELIARHRRRRVPSGLGAVLNGFPVLLLCVCVDPKSGWKAVCDTYSGRPGPAPMSVLLHQHECRVARRNSQALINHNDEHGDDDNDDDDDNNGDDSDNNGGDRDNNGNGDNGNNGNNGSGNNGNNGNNQDSGDDDDDSGDGKGGMGSKANTQEGPSTPKTSPTSPAPVAFRFLRSLAGAHTLPPASAVGLEHFVPPLFNPPPRTLPLMLTAPPPAEEVLDEPAALGTGKFILVDAP